MLLIQSDLIGNGYQKTHSFEHFYSGNKIMVFWGCTFAVTCDQISLGPKVTHLETCVVGVQASPILKTCAVALFLPRLQWTSRCSNGSQIFVCPTNGFSSLEPGALGASPNVHTFPSVASAPTSMVICLTQFLKNGVQNFSCPRRKNVKSAGFHYMGWACSCVLLFVIWTFPIWFVCCIKKSG